MHLPARARRCPSALEAGSEAPAHAAWARASRPGPGRAFVLNCTAVQPSTTHPPLAALWQLGPHPSAASAAPKIERLPANRAARKRVLTVTSMVEPHRAGERSAEPGIPPLLRKDGAATQSRQELPDRKMRPNKATRLRRSSYSGSSPARGPPRRRYWLPPLFIDVC